MVQRLELARPLALASGVKEVLSLRIVVPLLQAASVRDDDPAVPEACSSDDLVEKVALAFVAPPR